MLVLSSLLRKYMSFTSPSSSSDAYDDSSVSKLHRSLFILTHYLADMSGNKSHSRHVPGLGDLVRNVISFRSDMVVETDGRVRPVLEALIGGKGIVKLTLEQRRSIWNDLRLILTNNLVHRLEDWSAPMRECNLSSIRRLVDSIDYIYSTNADAASSSSPPPAVASSSSDL